MASLVAIQGTQTPTGEAELLAKQEAVFAHLRALGRVIIAYSGGTDSAYLAWAAGRALGDGAIAITADSASIPTSHKRAAEEFARECGFRHEYIETREFDNPEYVRNDKNRCFHCKDELFTRLNEYAAEHGYEHIVYGVNADDLGDYRPGQRAAELHEVEAPLVKANLTKAEIRELSRKAGLATWDRPAAACLSSRVPYGTPVTKETIRTIEEGEEAIRALGFRHVVDRHEPFTERIVALEGAVLLADPAIVLVHPFARGNRRLGKANDLAELHHRLARRDRLDREFVPLGDALAGNGDALRRHRAGVEIGERHADIVEGVEHQCRGGGKGSGFVHVRSCQAARPGDCRRASR